MEKKEAVMRLHHPDTKSVELKGHRRMQEVNVSLQQAQARQPWLVA